MFVQVVKKGRVYHDMEQKKVFTGELPIPTEATETVRDFLNKGFLKEVSDIEAKEAFQKASQEAERNALDNDSNNETEVKEAEEALAAKEAEAAAVAEAEAAKAAKASKAKTTAK